MSNNSGLGYLIVRTAALFVIGFAIGFFVVRGVAADERLPANEEKLIEHLIEKDVAFMGKVRPGRVIEIVVYSDKEGNIPDWLTCEYISSVSDVRISTLTFKDYTANLTLKQEYCSD